MWIEHVTISNWAMQIYGTFVITGRFPGQLCHLDSYHAPGVCQSTLGKHDKDQAMLHLMTGLLSGLKGFAG